MTIRIDCDHSDIYSSISSILDFEVTEDIGISVLVLKAAEAAESSSIIGSHLYDHEGHICNTSFKVPEGYVLRGDEIFKKPA